MTANRHYRRAMRPRDVIAELRSGSGAQWSPRAVDALAHLWDAVRLVPAAQAQESTRTHPPADQPAAPPVAVPVEA